MKKRGAQYDDQPRPDERRAVRSGRRAGPRAVRERQRRWPPAPGRARCRPPERPFTSESRSGAITRLPRLANIMKNPTAAGREERPVPEERGETNGIDRRPRPPHEEDRRSDDQHEAAPRDGRLEADHLSLGDAEEREPGREREREPARHVEVPYRPTKPVALRRSRRRGGRAARRGSGRATGPASARTARAIPTRPAMRPPKTGPIAAPAPTLAESSPSAVPRSPGGSAFATAAKPRAGIAEAPIRLHDAPRDEQRQGGGQRAKQRARGEEGEANGERAAAGCTGRRCARRAGCRRRRPASSP